MWGIPVPAIVGTGDWPEPVARPTGCGTWESVGIFGNDTRNGSELQAMLGFTLVVRVADWSTLIAPPTGRSTCDGSAILVWELPATWGIPTATAAVVGADELCNCGAGLRTQTSGIVHSDGIRTQFCNDGTNSKGRVPRATP